MHPACAGMLRAFNEKLQVSSSSRRGGMESLFPTQQLHPIRGYSLFFVAYIVFVVFAATWLPDCVSLR